MSQTPVLTRTASTGSADDARGLIAGAVLRVAREAAGLTQETLAERLRVAAETVQSWESGRRPLVNVPHIELRRVRTALSLALSAGGVRTSLLAVWDDALEADAMLDGRNGDGTHPLAHVVPDRRLSELLAWPFTGSPPRQLDGTRARLHVPPATRDCLAASLRGATDNCRDGERSAMLRRQARFLVVSHPASREWIADAEAREQRRPADLREWSPEWPVARSHAVAAALGGDPEPLQRFARDGLSTDRGMQANLSYWAYWTGETGERWSSDADMLDPQPWSGELLLGSLARGLESAPYRELCAHSAWALLRARPRLGEHPDLASRLLRAIEQVKASPELLSREALARLDQIAYRIGR